MRLGGAAELDPEPAPENMRRRMCPRQRPCHTRIQLACTYSCTPASGPTSGPQYFYYAQHPFPCAGVPVCGGGANPGGLVEEPAT